MNAGERPTPHAPRRIGTVIVLLAAGTALFVCASALDRLVLHSFRFPRADHKDWYRALRVAGYLPTWFAIGAAVFLHARRRAPIEAAKRGGFVVLSALLAGVAAEALKLLLRRQRPLGSDEYVFRSFTNAPFSSANLGLPSSHTLIAFAGAFAMARLLPATAPVWFLWAAGCALTRVIDGAHFLSDTVLGATVALPVSWSAAWLLRMEGTR